MSFQETGGGEEDFAEEEAGEEGEEGEEEEREEVEEVEAVDVAASLDGAVAEATTMFAKFLCTALLCAAREAAAAFRSRAGAMDARSDEVPTREARSIAECCECVRLKRERG